MAPSLSRTPIRDAEGRTGPRFGSGLKQLGKQDRG